MPVTVSLPSRRARRTAQAVAITAVVGASLGALSAADRHGESPAPGLAALQQTLPPAPPAPVAADAPHVLTAHEEPHLDWPLAKTAQEIRPQSVRPVAGALSSLFGVRWGAQHAGIDFADALGSPIAAVTDGVVLEAGPASGFGMWVRVRQDDGTVGVYGHVNDILVGAGQHVRAGDTIATVGNRGFSTGPHLHYEVWTQDNGDKIDPIPWLVARGIDVGALHD
ncbi:murein DD-endopeptidase MepM/ murein hydrolase activator NlpD [Nocardia transvalensis]|uniref:Murein DD-endopeptidase MepM/ murein hydrolase activator NlpD n=1 Tax=Nocardia transvalensis TaxID=37333 RepID=A0A7W9PJ67_9NOCA|nr:M23 family metallopeptidase [Nocardia transvalensis]MBB5917001.1 murein DD-endopeptidase MepM/ murein hydrolase activator NlpD [Nocardia transvalensis]